MRRLLLLAPGLMLSGCLIADHPATNSAPPPPPPPMTTSASHEPAEQHHPPPLPTPPLPPPVQRTISCDDATRIAMEYAANHQMGPMELRDCKVEPDGNSIRVSLKATKEEKHEHHGEKTHLKLKIDAHDGHVITDQDDDDEHGKGHGKGHDKD